MNPVLWLGVVLIVALLGWDWAVKKRRVADRCAMGDEEFLSFFREQQEKTSRHEVLAARRWIARELGLPESKIRPDDRLQGLRDDFCLVVSGHIALSDLHDDLRADSESADLETVADLISARLRSEAPGRARPAITQP